MAKIKVVVEGKVFNTEFSVDTSTGVVKDTSGSKVTKGDLQLVIAHLAEIGKRDVGAKVRSRYFGN